MPKIAQSSNYSSKKNFLNNSRKIKLSSIILLIFLSYVSGLLPASLQKNNSRIYANTSRNHPTGNSTPLSSEKTQTHQIKQILIGQSQVPTSTPIPPTPTSTSNQWGVAQKIDTHTYTMQVKQDSTMASPQEILTALNNFRAQHGSGALSWDNNLGNFADSRARTFSNNKTLDNHAGFLDFLNNQDGFRKLGFSGVGENSSYGFNLEAVHLIEWVYAGDEEHNSNQLNNSWHFAGIGVNGTATDIVFASNRL